MVLWDVAWLDDSARVSVYHMVDLRVVLGEPSIACLPARSLAQWSAGSSSNRSSIIGSSSSPWIAKSAEPSSLFNSSGPRIPFFETKPPMNTTKPKPTSFAPSSSWWPPSPTYMDEAARAPHLLQDRLVGLF